MLSRRIAVCHFCSRLEASLVPKVAAAIDSDRAIFLFFLGFFFIWGTAILVYRLCFGFLLCFVWFYTLSVFLVAFVFLCVFQIDVKPQQEQQERQTYREQQVQQKRRSQLQKVGNKKISRQNAPNSEAEWKDNVCDEDDVDDADDDDDDDDDDA